MRFRIRKNKGLLLITLFYALFIAIMVPLYNKAYLDDFAYVQSVKHLVVDGYFKISEWSAVTLIFQIFWGAFFSKLFGFSFINLQISTIIILYFGLIAFYFILRELNLDRWNSVFFTLALFSFPFIPLLAVSFMSDIPYLTLFIVSLYFYLKGLNRKSYLYLFWGSFFASLSFLTRQTGIVLPIAACLTIAFRKRTVFKNVISSVLLPLIVLIGYFTWLKVTNHQTYAQIYAFRHILWPSLSNAPTLIFRVGFYTLIIAAIYWPLSFIWLSRKNIKAVIKPKILFYSLVIVICLISVGVILRNIVTYSTTIVSPTQNAFAGNYSYFLSLVPYRLIRIIWVTNLFISLFLISFLLVLFHRRFKKVWLIRLIGIKSTSSFLIYAFLLVLAWILVLPFHWAEYTIPLLPFVIVGFASVPKKVNKTVASAVIVFLIYVSFLNAKITHTILGINWQKAEKLVQTGVSPAEINTGEYAWYPWWYYEETFASALSKVGGDKSKLTRLQTWEFPNEKNYKYRLKL